MPRNVLLAETQNIQWPTGLARPDDKVRLGHTVACLLDLFRRASQTRADQLRLGALKVGLIEYIVREKFEDAYAALGKLTGRGIPDGVCPRCGAAGVVEGIPGGKSLPRRELP